MRRPPATAVVSLAVVAAAVVVGVAGAAPPTITVPSNLKVEATSSAGAQVTYTATAQNAGGQPVDLTCAPPPNTTGHGTVTATADFPLGQTVVTCTVSDSTGVVDSQASFTVTVVDTTPPKLSMPTAVSVTATSTLGTSVTYTVTALDLVDGQVQPNCSPASGTQFPVGVTTVTCTATDAHGNSASGTFTVTVTGPTSSPGDTTPPVFTSIPGPLAVEATGPNGATVSYVPPSATDAHDGPIASVRCSPGSGSLFPLGQTKVQCVASDAAGNTATTSFTVAVVDTTPPTLAVPGPTTVQATAADGISASAPEVVAFLTAPVARDLVDPAPKITNDAPAHFPIGDTRVTFKARDASGNTTTKVSTLTVVAPTTTPAPTPSTPTPTSPGTFKPPTVAPPPPDVRGFTAKPGRGQITLSWSLPTSGDFDHLELLRAQASVGVQMTLIYRGSGRNYVDRHVDNGQSYRYEIVSVGHNGDRSSGVALTAFPLPLRLLVPLAGTRLHAAPQMRWLPTPKASYYNLQLYRDGVKVLSTWPTTSQYRLPKTWSYLGRTYRFGPGTYRWYVWAGFGSRAARNYGPLLGQAFFAAVP